MGKKLRYHPLIVCAFLLVLLLPLQGCEVVGGIFKAGIWTGVLIVAGIAGLLVYLFTRGRNK